tara:strand:+ start:897 stop:1808 length:912 start_codon:yes stop_codon:yes gene_type:complete
MSLLLGIVLAFMALIIGSPLIALFLGISFTLLIGSAEGLILKSIGTKLLQIGIVILGLTISSSGAITLTAKYFPYISIFVIVIFLIGFIISKVLKIDTKLSILLVSGTAICGATAMVAISPLIKAKPKDLLISLGVIFIFNAVAIAILPIIGNNIEMSSEQFGSWMALAVHDTSSVIGAAMSFGDNAVETATTLKLGRTLWLIPLMIILGIVYKDNKSTRNILPLFVIAFILAIFVGNQINFNEQAISILKNTSSIFLVGALFSIGTQIDLMSIKVINSKVIIFALSLWLFALSAAYYLVNII